MRDFCILGTGSWGTAIATLLVKNSRKPTYIWSREQEVADSINKNNENIQFLPDIKLNKFIIAETNIKKVLANIAFIAIPSQYVRPILIEYIQAIKKINLKNKKLGFVICSKGVELQTGYLLSEVINDLVSDANIAVLSGPSFARPVSLGLPTAVTLASENNRFRDKIIELIGSNVFRPYESSDIIGTQINGTIKNIIAIASGITEGLGLGQNARAAIITRGIKEISDICIKMGGKQKSILGLSGLGDIILTCTSSVSRNYYLGNKIGQGKSIEEIVKGKVEVTEGLSNSKSIYNLTKKLKLETPIIDAVYYILNEKRDVKRIVKALLERPFTKE